MCFKNLPVAFDEAGKAYLKEGISDPYAVKKSGNAMTQEEKIRSLMAKNGHIKEVSIDPVTRVAGALAFHSVVNLQDRKVEDAHSMATLFRGYEIILKGRDPRDAIFISSRACGVCGGVHANCGAEAIEMALGVAPPLRHLSMGMSADYGVAILEGATIVRVGSALFEHDLR